MTHGRNPIQVYHYDEAITIAALAQFGTKNRVVPTLKGKFIQAFKCNISFDQNGVDFANAGGIERIQVHADFNSMTVATPGRSANVITHPIQKFIGDPIVINSVGDPDFDLWCYLPQAVATTGIAVYFDLTLYYTDRYSLFSDKQAMNFIELL